MSEPEETAASTPAASAATAQSRARKTGGGPAARPHGRAELGKHYTLGARIVQGFACRSYERQPEDPVYRPLRIYALDPSASIGDGALAVVNVPYEPIQQTAQGLHGAILEVVDDCGCGAGAAEIVDLEERFLLMQQGLKPSPEDTRFRQQMAYAVASTTYAAFRQALGREVGWGFRSRAGDAARLRIRPGIAELQNAYYDSARGEVRFGTFTASSTVTGRNVPGGRISLCLSHDVVVHEMSHALLDGLRSHFLHPSNLDVLAFHEAFADLIAIFQRFTYRDVVSAAIRASRGVIPSAQLLTNIAVQFAQAMNATGALRCAVGTARRYEDTVEPHQRGEILVTAVFEAFTKVYERKTAPLLRLASGGTGVLLPGEIPEGLAAQLTDRASALASQFLSICIRAIDYCPPVDITFGEFLRAVLTADADLVPHDPWAYREAWIDAFASRRIYPPGVASLSEAGLLLRSPEQQIPPQPELSFASLKFDGDPGRAASVDETLRQARAFGQLAADPRYCGEFGLAVDRDPKLEDDPVSLPVVESIRSSRRVGPSGQVVFDLVAEITQRRSVRSRAGQPGFDFFGGATVILDPRGQVRYVVRKSILDSARLARQREFVQGPGAQFFGLGPSDTRLPQSKLLLQLHDITRPQLRSGAGTRALVKGMPEGVEVAAARRYLMRQGDSEPPVRLLKACLNRCVTPSPMLDGTPAFDEATERAVSAMQSQSGASVDGIVGPATWTITGRKLGHDLTGLPLDADTPRWIRGLLSNDPQTTRLAGLNVAAALDMYEFVHGALSISQRAGLSGLLEALRADPDITDLRWAAYMLATVKHECADSWHPIEEFGKGAGREYGKLVSVTAPDGSELRNAYYGRGYVQLTWLDNYRAVGQAIKLGDALMLHPERALEPATAYAIMSHGMRHGTFTGKALARYINATGTDYLNARRIINGTDRAQLIAGYAGRLETMLLANT